MINKVFDKKVFAKRFSDIMKENNETIYTIAEFLHLSPSAISKYTNAVMAPKQTAIEALSIKFHLNPLWLMGADVPKTLVQPKYIKVPVVGVIRAGEPILAEQNIIDYINIPENMAKGDDVFGLKVVGDSMNNARIYPNDTVIVEKQPEVENGEIAVVLIDSENATVKRFYQTDTTVTLVPESSNPIYKPRVIDSKKTKVEVLGKVIGALIKF